MIFLLGEGDEVIDDVGAGDLEDREFDIEVGDSFDVSISDWSNERRYLWSPTYRVFFRWVSFVDWRGERGIRGVLT